MKGAQDSTSEYYTAAPAHMRAITPTKEKRKQDIGGRGHGWYLDRMMMNDFTVSTLDLGLERLMIGAWRR
jgi:hypothetical protein